MSIVQTLVPKFLAVQISSYSRLSNLLPRSFCKTIREHARPQSQSDLCRTWGSSICRRDISLRNCLKYISNCSGKSCTIKQHNRINQANIDVVFSGRAGTHSGWSSFELVVYKQTWRQSTPTMTFVRRVIITRGIEFAFGIISINDTRCFYMLDGYVCNIILPIPTLTFLPLIFRLKVFEIIVMFYDFHLSCSFLSLRDRDLLMNQK